MSKKTSNRVQPAIAGKLGLPSTYKDTYGVGDGPGGSSVAAGGGGNRTTPAVANKLKPAPSYDAYRGDSGK